MYIEYDDIISRIPDKPIWWLDGVPRYDPFRPDDVGVYPREAALVRTACQTCGNLFDIGFAAPSPDYPFGMRPYLAIHGALWIGDPPNNFHKEDSCTGRMKGSDEIAIVEFWRRPDSEWVRDSTMERPLPNGHDAHGLADLIAKAGLKERYEAVDAGDDAAMLAILQQAGCDSPWDVIRTMKALRLHGRFETEMRQLNVWIAPATQ
ncbi:hypothetical protein U1839_01890 [Sphingomonas sp. RT2P30]|uniref:hypothetical protein n=1 Tax=Parasphingomonas halimpatiens TaxID=3096162 RepID=UPI002FC9137F